MFKHTDGGRALGRSAALACVGIAATIVAMSSAMAGECPAGKLMAGAREPVSFPANGVTDTVLAAIDLAKEPANLKDRQLRFRKLTIEPGGVVPWHSHADRPAIIYVAEGEIVEYASNCAEPIVHKTGEVKSEISGVSHWWKNLGTKTVILFVGDVLHDKNDHNM